MSNDNKIFLSILGVIALAADLVTLGQFIVSGKILDFWSGQWIIGIMFVIGLLFVGFGLLSMAKAKKLSAKVEPVLGGIFGVLSMSVYLNFGYFQVFTGNGISSFFGYSFLFIISSIVTLSCFLDVPTRKIKYPLYINYSSYGFAVCNLIFIFILIYKYIFRGDTFGIFKFFGELAILVLGAVFFLFFFNLNSKSTEV